MISHNSFELRVDGVSNVQQPGSCRSLLLPTQSIKKEVSKKEQIIMIIIASKQ